MQNEHINMIYIEGGSDVDFVNTYCNATLESDSTEAKPYPYRFECQSMGTRTLKLLKQDNFPAWDASFYNRKVILYLKYIINNNNKSGTSSSWTATAYTQDIVSSEYRVSAATGTFEISEFQSPHISKINFLTKAWNKRTCKTNQLCMFYGYLLPSTLISDIPIEYMTFTLPREFNYSS